MGFLRLCGVLKEVLPCYEEIHDIPRYLDSNVRRTLEWYSEVIGMLELA